MLPLELKDKRCAGGGAAGGTAFLGAASAPSRHRAGGTVYVKIKPKHFEVCGVFLWFVLSKLM